MYLLLKNGDWASCLGGREGSGFLTNGENA